MYPGRSGIVIVFMLVHLLTAGAFLYFMYCISKSLKRIAKNLEKKTPSALEGTQAHPNIE
jgi:hypothetical protein